MPRSMYCRRYWGTNSKSSIAKSFSKTKSKLPPARHMHYSRTPFLGCLLYSQSQDAGEMQY
jgi:hypothetical protein